MQTNEEEILLSQLVPQFEAGSSIWSLSNGQTFFNWNPWNQLFIALILGIGSLVAIHAWGYFKDRSSKIKFFSVFLPFALSMAGVVTLNHVLLFFIAWEFTSLLSYFLITFKPETPEARRGGQHSLLVTGLGGLCLLGGLILLGTTQGVWTLNEAQNLNLRSNPAGPWIVGLIALGALTKSAQFPFHFWLSGAMTAPTPASAFLHSATMVKAGVFLLYLLWPMMSSVAGTGQIIFILGVLTFTWGAFSSLLQLDLKGVLAGTTIAHLGLMTAMIAWPNQDLSKALFAIVVSHAIYKAGLFLFSGVIEKLAQTRRIDLMSGLRIQSPFIFGIGVLLAGASLGLPGTLAYSAKSLLDLPLGWKLALTLGFLILGKAGLLVAVRPFLGTPSNANQPEKGLTLMWIPPLVLGLISWLAVPLGLYGSIAWDAKNLLTSLIAAIVAVLLLRKWSPAWQRFLSRGPWLSGARAFDWLWYSHLDFAKLIRHIIQPKSLTYFVMTTLGAFTLGVIALVQSYQIPQLMKWPESIPLTDVFVWLCFGKVLGTIFVLRTKSPILSILFVGLVGYLFALVLALAGAPDLAMTQFSVETLSLLVLLYAIKDVPAETQSLGLNLQAQPVGSGSFETSAKIILSVLAGGAVAMVTFMASISTVDSRLRQYFSETSWLEAHGRNVVNVILVDFRALDTLGEITVLGVAALGMYLLLSAQSGPKRSTEQEPKK